MKTTTCKSPYEIPGIELIQVREEQNIMSQITSNARLESWEEEEID